MDKQNVNDYTLSLSFVAAAVSAFRFSRFSRKKRVREREKITAPFSRLNGNLFSGKMILSFKNIRIL